MYSNEIFGVSVEESVLIEEEVAVTDNSAKNWEAPANELLNVLDEECDQLVESEDESETQSQPLDLLDAFDYIQKLTNLALIHGMDSVITELSSIRSSFEKVHLLKYNKNKQSLLTDYFKIDE